MISYTTFQGRLSNEVAMSAAEILRREADRYQLENGAPGPLATIWGWRAIAEELRRVATIVENEAKP